MNALQTCDVLIIGAAYFWGDPELSLWDDFAQSVKQLDLDCEHQRIVKPPILPEVAEFVRQACGLAIASDDVRARNNIFTL
jgi:thioesterase domain-containing protein